MYVFVLIPDPACGHVDVTEQLFPLPSSAHTFQLSDFLVSASDAKCLGNKYLCETRAFLSAVSFVLTVLLFYLFR